MNLDLNSLFAPYSYPFFFIGTIGSHLYGFAAQTSDYDIRGVHILPVEEALGVLDDNFAIYLQTVQNNCEIDIISYDIRKFFQMLNESNATAIETLFATSLEPESNAKWTTDIQTLRNIAPQLFVQSTAGHYFGYAKKQYKLTHKYYPNCLKPVLHYYRNLLTFIFFIENKEINCYLPFLAKHYGFEFILSDIHRVVDIGKQDTLLEAPMLFKNMTTVMSLAEKVNEKANLPYKHTHTPLLNEMLLNIRKLTYL